MVTSGSNIEYVDGTQWGVITGIYEAPNRDLVGRWAQAKNLTPRTTGGGEWQRMQEPGFYIKNADNVRYWGEARFKKIGDQGQRAYQMTLTDSKGIEFLSTSLFYLGEYGRVLVGGVYRDKYTEMNITELWEKSKWIVDGTFTHMGKKYNVKGDRTFTRGALTLIDPAYGSTVGQVLYGYAPQPSQVTGFRSGNFERTDTLLINFTVPGSPAVQTKYLSR